MIWLIGNKGMLGSELSLLLEKNNMAFIGTDKEIDITNPLMLHDFAAKQRISWIINCAAYTAVDKAEDDKNTCKLINTDGAANIAKLAKSIGAVLIHLSTDYVFDGKGNRPYTEDDSACPTGVYGRTKYDGEIIILKENPLSYIIRTAWLYGYYGSNFVNTMLKFMKEKKYIRVVNDQYGSPTWSCDLSSVIISIIRQTETSKNIPYGIFHYTNEGFCTWFEFAETIYEEGINFNILSKPCKIIPCSSDEYPSKVKRPSYSVLDKTKIKKYTGLEIPEWKESLKKYLKLV